jgi:hypothetical protein
MSPAGATTAAARAIARAVLGRLPAVAGGRAVCAGEVVRLAAHIELGGEIWGGVVDGTAFVRRTLLCSELDPGARTAIELDVDEIPAPARSRALLHEPITLRFVRATTAAPSSTTRPGHCGSSVDRAARGARAGRRGRGGASRR